MTLTSDFFSSPSPGLVNTFDQAVSLPPVVPDCLVTGKPVIEISHSSSGTLATCMRKYQIRKRFHWPDNAEREDSLAAMSGRAIHVYVQTMYSTGDEYKAADAFMREWDFNIEITSIPRKVAEVGLPASFNTAFKLCQHLAPSPDKLALIIPPGGTDTQPAVEVKFNIILSHSRWKYTYHYRGLIDLILYEALSNEYTVVDIKTHRSNRPYESHRYQYATQTIPYGLVLEEMIGENNLLRGFRTQYVTAFTDIVEPKFAIFDYNKTHADVVRWLQDQALQIESVERIAHNPVWPRTQHGCESYGKACYFFGRYCDVEPVADLQSAILGFEAPAPWRDFNPLFTIHINLDEIWE